MGRRRHRVLVGFSYRAGDGEVRHEPDELVEDLPAAVAEALAKAGAIAVVVVDGEDVPGIEAAGQKEE